MKKDINQILIETTVRKALRDMNEAPERTMRNLVELGLDFSGGSFQKRFFTTLQDMLQNSDSPYYDLIKDVIASVDHKTLTALGVNWGYNACGKGAKIIRALEADRGFNIPWSLSLNISGDKLDTQPGFYRSLVDQGTEIGIYSYFLYFEEGDAAKLLPLMAERPDCAFVLFLRGAALVPALIESLKSLHNVMISISADEDMPRACRQMRAARLLYATHLRYTERETDAILNGSWLNSILPARPYFAFLLADGACGEPARRAVYDYIVSARNEHRAPVVLMDVRQDVLSIDKVISEDECMVGFDTDGHLYTFEGRHADPQNNIFASPLFTILEQTQKKSKKEPS